MSKDYGQFCGISRAAQVLGERWALMIVRDLTVSPRRFTDLHEGLPGIPTTVLTTRLRELEESAVITRRAAPAPARGVLYELTPRGHDLQPILDALGRWGAEAMDTPRESEVVTDSSLAAALRSAHRPDGPAGPLTYHVRSGAASAWATTCGDEVTVGPGEPSSDPELTINAGPELRLLLAGTLTPEEALASGDVTIAGSRHLLEEFSRSFHIPLSSSTP
ncbi:winged helix-turn-helix transcriptional regulator [Brevibacterium sp. UCMA 11754]|uniref:winged helix-turn-helix transcriptional regulator n=1 Tax=Brevibacterium sp. UCMA 11754 TaxID=2749198 RepID=UPI001F1B3F38|nr:helix-turn-helix domain-containing protein [Brevibacterium sp. UCMA 11754]MCF2571470.1 helix-turn-helix transcriptional regulator [Brevibacterium sp. UCMA 11754]